MHSMLKWPGAGLGRIRSHRSISIRPFVRLGRDIPPATPFLYLRIADDLVAAAAAVMLFFFLSRWTEPLIAFVVATGWSVASNHYIFVDSGFKNSIMAATLVYLSALWFLSGESKSGPFWAGLLIPVAIFLREAFLPIVFVSLYFAAARHARRGVLLHFVGLSVAGCALLFWLYIFRGPPGEILDYFQGDLPRVFAAWPRLGVDVSSWRWKSLRGELRLTDWFHTPALLGVIWFLAPGRGERVAKGLALILFVPPCYEIFIKFCHPYHWAATASACRLPWSDGFALAFLDRQIAKPVAHDRCRCGPGLPCG